MTAVGIVGIIILFLGAVVVWLPHIWLYLMEEFIIDPLYIETGVWWERAALYIDKNIQSVDGMFDCAILLGIILFIFGTVLCILLFRKKKFVLFTFVVIITLLIVAGILVEFYHSFMLFFDV